MLMRDHEREEDDHRRDDVRQDVGEDQPPVARAEADRGLDELLLAHREHLAADRPGDVRHVDDADDDDRQPEAAGRDGDRADRDAAASARRSRARSPAGTPGTPRARRAGARGPDRRGRRRSRRRARRSSPGSSTARPRRRRSAASCARRRAGAPRRRGPGCRRRGSSGRSPRSGPIGVTPRPRPPVDSTITGAGLPLTIVVPSSVDSNGSVWATRWAYQPAARHAATIRRKPTQRRDRDAVAEQSPPRERPRAAADDVGRAHVADHGRHLSHSRVSPARGTTGPRPVENIM